MLRATTCERIARTAYILGAILVAAVLFSLIGRLAYTAPLGAPIPVRPGGYYPPPAARNNCLETYSRSKRFSCDRIALRTFD